MSGKSRVLIVDDNQQLLRAYGHFLKENGYQASGAQTGEAAISAIEQRQFDIIVLDLALPGMSGLEFLQKLKATANGDMPAVLVISGAPAAHSRVFLSETQSTIFS